MISEKIKNFTNKISKEILITILVFFMLLFTGYVIGRTAGTQIVKGLLKGERYVLMPYRLPFEYLYTANLLYSNDELRRLEGYYSLLDNRIIDPDLLIERFKQESDLIKPVIIWLLGYSEDKDDALNFLSDEYAGSEQRIKKEILRTMKRLDESYFLDFTASHKINIKELP
ncbi:MAG: hypothetical protein JXN64_00975 [Spirochaetes bacterium]|nr:hypothetical protein [Spirochaetota bacterium]